MAPETPRTFEDVEGLITTYTLDLRESDVRTSLEEESARADRMVARAHKEAEDIRAAVQEKIMEVQRLRRDGVEFTDEQRQLVQNLITAYNEDSTIGMVVGEELEQVVLPSESFHATGGETQKRLPFGEVDRLVTETVHNCAEGYSVSTAVCAAGDIACTYYHELAGKTLSQLTNGGYDYTAKPKWKEGPERMTLEELLKFLVESNFKFRGPDFSHY